MTDKIVWPEKKPFVFTVFDDTDCATLENVRPVYDFLRDLGIRTTKSCWVQRGDLSRGRFPGQTCDDAPYRRWLLELQSQGFEIGWHGTTWHDVPREATIAGLDRFAAIFGHDPCTMANHTGAAQGVYWAESRLAGFHIVLYNLLTRFRNHGRYRGHIEGDEHYWGDICQARIKYCRNFVFQNINSLNACPYMPYHDTLHPLVNHWFVSSNGRDIETFNRCLAEKNQDRLEEEGGACIMYTHFAYGFVRDGEVEPRFRQLLERLVRKGGWYVPVGTLLDYMLATRGPHVITDGERRRLERKWLLEKLWIGTT